MSTTPKIPSLTVIPQGTAVPSRVASPNQIRAAKLPYGQDLAKDLEFLSKNINDLHGLLSTNTPSLASVPGGATPSAAGIVQLAQDLGGSAAAPLVVGLQGTPIKGATPSSGQVLAYAASDKEWEPVSNLNVASIAVSGAATAASIAVSGPATAASVTAPNITATSNLTASAAAVFNAPASMAFGNNWQNWTPAFSASGTMTVSGVSLADAQYLVLGPLVFVKLWVTFTLGGNSDLFVYVTLPVSVIGQASALAAMMLEPGQSVFLPGVANADPVNQMMLRSGLTNTPQFPKGTYTVGVEGFYRSA
jgi:hypothetical protein